MTVRDLPLEDQPEAKLLNDGDLTDSEVLALLLQNGGHGKDPLTLARSLLLRAETLHHLVKVPVQELASWEGMNRDKAARLKAALILARRIQSGDNIASLNFGSSSDVAAYFMPRLRDLQKERFIVVLLDARNRLIKEMTVSEGSLTASIVHPREVFKPAILASAASVIFVHNHPSGDPTPSQDDLRVTAQLVEAGRIIDIRVLDHIIVGHRTFTSLGSKGLI